MTQSAASSLVFVACDGHVRGHCDGLIQGGLKEAPQTAHVWEHKAVNETKFKKPEKADCPAR